MTKPDVLDLALLGALAEDPRAGVSDLASRLGFARNTIHARLRKLEESGVLAGYATRVDLHRLGFPVIAFLHLQLAQGALRSVIEALGQMPQVLEVCTTTGSSDLMVRVAGRHHAELEDLIQVILAVPGVVRSTTEIALTTPIEYRIGPLLALMEQGAKEAR